MGVSSSVGKLFAGNGVASHLALLGHVSQPLRPHAPSHGQRKSLRERWLMDGAAEEPERPQDPTSQDPQSPEDQAQARIRNLEDSLFT